MQSTIKVEFGMSNQPIIRMKCRISDDVRDVLFNQFLQTFKGNFNLCQVTIMPGGDATTLEIEPLPSFEHSASTPTESINQILGIEMAIRETRNLAWTSLCYDGDRVWWENKNHGNNANPPTSLSPLLDRRQLEKLNPYDLTKKIISIFDNIENWNIQVGHARPEGEV